MSINNENAGGPNQHVADSECGTYRVYGQPSHRYRMAIDQAGVATSLRTLVANHNTKTEVMGPVPGIRVPVLASETSPGKFAKVSLLMEGPHLAGRALATYVESLRGCRSDLRVVMGSLAVVDAIVIGSEEPNQVADVDLDPDVLEDLPIEMRGHLGSYYHQGHRRTSLVDEIISARLEVGNQGEKLGVLELFRGKVDLELPGLSVLGPHQVLVVDGSVVENDLPGLDQPDTIYRVSNHSFATGRTDVIDKMFAIS